MMVRHGSPQVLDSIADFGFGEKSNEQHIADPIFGFLVRQSKI
jgi:hypothetical protein